ncbi:MAG: hypothetical protein II532_00205 [Bacteroidales bacterium]|nr:hypothetical protein [Bacteroidales bacterium]
MKRLFVLLTIAMLPCFPLMAQNVSSHWDTSGVSLGSKATVTIGDQIDLVISVVDTKMNPYIFPAPDQIALSKLEVIGQRYDTVQKGQQVTVSQHTTVTSFDEGTYSTGALTIQVGASIVGVDSLMLTVNDVANVDTTKAEIKGIAPIMREPYTFWELFRWVLLLIVVAGLVWLVFFIREKIKKREPIIVRPAAPPVPADREALDNLESLRVKSLWQSGKAKEYHTELTDIVRRYIRRQYDIETAEMTSDQTLEAFHDNKVCDEENYSLLRQILRTADMVKFAKAEPQPYEHDQAMKNAVQFVETTAAKSNNQSNADGGDHFEDVQKEESTESNN